MSIKIIGFSKLSKQEKIEWICSNYLDDYQADIEILDKYLNTDTNIQSIHDTFSENTLSNFYFPFSIAPNFLINNNDYCLPMAIEESSVVAAACNSAKFWYDRGGFVAKTVSIEKIGQIHFLFKGDFQKINSFVNKNKTKLIDSTSKISLKMKERGGGINSITLIDKSSEYNNYYQLSVSFIGYETQLINLELTDEYPIKNLKTIKLSSTSELLDEAEFAFKIFTYTN